MVKHVVVTGAGAGIGRAMAVELAASGHALLLLGRNRESLEATRALLERPGAHGSFPCDVREPGEIRAALAASGVESVYAVVANAGLGGENRYGSTDRWPEIVATNLTGSYNTVQECLPYLRRDPAPYPRILFLSSLLARIHGD